MVEKAVIKEKLGSDRYNVMVVDSEACQNCGGSCKVKHRIVTVEDRNHGEYKVGQMVDIEVKALEAVGMGFMIFIFPLVLFAVLFAVGTNILMLPELPAVGLGIAGFITAFLITWILKSTVLRDTYPEILRN